MATTTTNGIEVENKELNHLGFLRIAAVRTFLLVSNLYEYAKNNSGPFRSAIGTAESTVITILNHLYTNFKGVPDHFLLFIDNKVDEVSDKLYKHAPPFARKLADCAKGLIQKVTHGAEKVASKARSAGPRAAVDYVATESKNVVLISSVKVWSEMNHYAPFHAMAELAVPTAAHWSEKYNHVIKIMAEKGYSVAGYLPLIPTDAIAKAFKQGEGNLKGDHDSATAEERSE